MTVALGVDWAGDSWLCLEQQSQGVTPTPKLYESIRDLWADYDDGTDIDRLCIDIPIGLPTGPDERAVDKACRSQLARKSTVFRVPVKDALDTDSPEVANRKSRAATKTEDDDGVGVQPPAYAIRKQIRDVNEFIDEREDAVTNVIYEVHPELCFRAFLGTPPQYGKKTAHGVAERIEALTEISDGDGAAIVGDTLSAVKDNIDGDSKLRVDDVLDGLAAMYTAAAPDSEFHLLVGDDTAEPERTQRMAYRSPTELPPVESG